MHKHHVSAAERKDFLLSSQLKHTKVSCILSITGKIKATEHFKHHVAQKTQLQSTDTWKHLFFFFSTCELRITTIVCMKYGIMENYF